MKKILYLLLLLPLFSCNSTVDGEVKLLNNLSFVLTEGEKVSPVDALCNNRYTANFNFEETQIPLFKYIKHEDYDIFIGLPFDSSIEKMVQELEVRNDSVFEISSSVKNTNAFYISKTSGDLFAAEYATKTKNKSLLYIAVLSLSEENIDKGFDYNGIAGRIKVVE
jgi:hypothetical protein